MLGRGLEADGFEKAYIGRTIKTLLKGWEYISNGVSLER
ncbi:hypothetical protein LSO9J_360003 [Candidatus Liberibacter solanacearum]